MAEQLKYNNGGTVQIFRRNIAKRDKIDTNNTQLYDRSLYKLGRGTSIKSGDVKLGRGQLF